MKIRTSHKIYNGTVLLSMNKGLRLEKNNTELKNWNCVKSRSNVNLLTGLSETWRLTYTGVLTTKRTNHSLQTETLKCFHDSYNKCSWISLQFNTSNILPLKLNVSRISEAIVVYLIG